MKTSIDALLEERGLQALVLASRSFRDPSIAPLLGGGRVSYSLAVIAPGRPARLGYISPMEREEAKKSRLPLLTPEDLEVGRHSQLCTDPADFWAAVIHRALYLCELPPPGALALAGSLPLGLAGSLCRQLEAEGWRVSAGEPLADRLRKAKTDHQLAAIRRAALGTMEAFREVAGRLARATADTDGALVSDGEPCTVGSLRRLIARVLADHQLEQPEGNIVAPAEEGAVAHSIGTDSRRLRAGESLVVDIFPRGDLFADCTRTFCVGPPGDGLARGYRRVRENLEAADAAAQAGVSGWTLQQQACAFFERAGEETPISHPGTQRGYVHGLGHGVGYEVHELPSFREQATESEGTLEAGDVITLEPGLYRPDEGWAVRLEDLYLVNDSGVENLTPLPRDLDPRAWFDGPS
ncbi:MAG: M24 family metallopeptidase [Acidobacteriota bacterium]